MRVTTAGLLNRRVYGEHGSPARLHLANTASEKWYPFSPMRPACHDGVVVAGGQLYSGPYIWDNSWDRSCFTDGVHPAPRALEIFVDKYWQHLSHDRVAPPWLFAPAAGVKH